MLLILFKYMKKIFFSLFFIFLFFFAPLANASILSPEVRSKINANTEQFNTSAGYDSGTDLLGVIRTVIVAILSLLAVIFLVLLIYAGFKWMTAAGDSDDVKKAKATLKTAIIGLVIIFASYGLTYFIFNQMTFFSGTAPTPNEGVGNIITGSSQ